MRAALPISRVEWLQNQDVSLSLSLSLTPKLTYKLDPKDNGSTVTPPSRCIFQIPFTAVGLRKA